MGNGKIVGKKSIRCCFVVVWTDNEQTVNAAFLCGATKRDGVCCIVRAGSGNDLALVSNICLAPAKER